MSRPRLVDYGTLADLARTAIGMGLPAATHVATALNIDHRQAARGIIAARRLGYDIPPIRKQPTAPGLLLRCDCGRTYPVTHAMDLARHTWREHRRPPATSERTPR